MSSSKGILIIGSGVSGLTCGVTLQEHGFDTKIIASKIPPETTSNVAPAYWYPYKVNPLEKVLKWGAVSYKYYTGLKDIDGSGISFTNLIKLYDNEVPNPSWAQITKNFSTLTKADLPDGYSFGFRAEVPLVETPIYIRYLYNRYIGSGGMVDKLDRDIESVHYYTEQYNMIINCTGLGSYTLFDDKNMYPIRGQIVRTTNPGLKNIYNDEGAHLALSYIVPRSGDCILGGTADENNWNTEVDQATSRRIMQNCIKIQPELKNATILENIVGLRPGRNEVRLEYEKHNSRCSIIHNYGHGGAGVTLSWGCAEEVLELVQEYI